MSDDFIELTAYQGSVYIRSREIVGVFPMPEGNGLFFATVSTTGGDFHVFEDVPTILNKIIEAEQDHPVALGVDFGTVPATVVVAETIDTVQM